MVHTHFIYIFLLQISIYFHEKGLCSKKATAKLWKNFSLTFILMFQFYLFFMKKKVTL